MSRIDPSSGKDLILFVKKNDANSVYVRIILSVPYLESIIWKGISIISADTVNLSGSVCPERNTTMPNERAMMSCI